MKHNIEELRMEIDKIDQEIIELLVKRYDVVSLIGEVKKNKKLMIDDFKREQIIMEKIVKNSGIYEQKIINVYQEIIKNAKDIQCENLD